LSIQLEQGIWASRHIGTSRAVESECSSVQ
jgi:hypothetical protein